MTKADILFDWLISHLKHLTDSNDVEQFAEGLGDKAEHFGLLMDQMVTFQEALVKAKAANDLFDSWDDLIRLFLELETQYAAIPDLKPHKTKLLLLLGKTISSFGVPLDTTALNTGLFVVQE
jgi:hypothetical protein